MHFPLLSLAACTPPVGETAPAFDSGFTDGGSRGHSAVGNPEITGRAGSIVLAEWPPDAEYAETIHFGRGLFVSDGGGVVNLAGCLFASSVCTRDLGEPGATVIPEDPTFLETATFEDAGTELLVGDGALARTFDYSIPIYAGEPPFSGSTDVAWDGDLAAYEGTDVFSFADAMVVTSPDPTQRIALGPGGTVDLQWASGGAGDVFLRVGDELRHLVDDGQETVVVADMDLAAPIDTALLILSRKSFSQVDANGNDVWIETTSDQWLYVDYTDTDGWTELKVGTELGEDCGAAGPLPPIGPGQYYGDLTAAADDHDLGASNPVTGWETPGTDAVFGVQLTAGQVLDLTYTQHVWDASVYVLDASCWEGGALEGADDLVDGEPEHLVFSAPADGLYRVVLDGYYSGGPWSMVFDVQ